MNHSELPRLSLTACFLSLGLGVYTPGCGGTAPGTASAAPAAAPPAPAHTTAAPAHTGAPGSSEPALLETTADLRGRGVERIHLDSAGVLHVGELSTPVERVPASAANTYHWKAQASLRPVALAPELNAVLLTIPTPDSEDPPNVHQLFVGAGNRLLRVLEVMVYGDFEVHGDGTASYVEHGWSACDRLGYPEQALRQRVTFALSEDGARMTEARREDTDRSQVCAELAACPFVYAVTEAGEVLLGEILRNLRGASASALQSLAVPPASDRVLRLLLKEEKPEVTYLEEVYLEIGGLRVQPRACVQGGTVPVYCDAALGAHVIRQGDILELEFELPESLDASAPLLFARGYYVPVSAAAATMD